MHLGWLWQPANGMAASNGVSAAGGSRWRGSWPSVASAASLASAGSLAWPASWPAKCCHGSQWRNLAHHQWLFGVNTDSAAVLAWLGCGVALWRKVMLCHYGWLISWLCGNTGCG